MNGVMLANENLDPYTNRQKMNKLWPMSEGHVYQNTEEFTVKFHQWLPDSCVKL